MRQISSYQKGLWAEWLVAFYLRFIGYKILAKRYKTKFGEIDLIARKNNVLIFVEVKARKNQEDGLEAVTLKTQKRIINAAKIFIQNYEQEVMAIRFDVAAVSAHGIVEHIRNAFCE
ncbi:MAG: YraN family protein [Micavibrio sp.]|nr:YraN family protein [Micavibrio sp.]|tara:strand:+ start:698 stop:1048 length:351 start_codon:yes stop_codon:yes gene_type:complete